MKCSSLTWWLQRRTAQGPLSCESGSHLACPEGLTISPELLFSSLSSKGEILMCEKLVFSPNLTLNVKKGIGESWTCPFVVACMSAFFFFFKWSIVGLQCCVVSGVQQRLLIYMFIYVYKHTHTYTGSCIYSFSASLPLWCRKDGACICALCRSSCSSVVYRGVCSCSSQAPNLSHLPPFLLW